MRLILSKNRPLKALGAALIIWAGNTVFAQAAAADEAVLHNGFQAENFSPEQAEVWRVIEKWNSAFTRNAADEYFEFIDEAITVLTPSNPYRVEGLPDDREEFEFGIRKGYSRVSLFQEIAPIVRVYGDVAYVTYFNRGYYGPEGSGKMIYLKETDVLVKRKSGWKIVHIHVSD